MARRSSKQQPPGMTRGAELLAEWRGDRSAAEACIALQINEAAFYAFVAGRAVPGLRRAVHIQEGTDGHVPVSSWIEPTKSKTRKAA